MQRTRHHLVSAGSILGLALLAACGQGVDPAIVAKAETAQPADPDLAALYNQSCKACHGRSGSGAPLTGYTKVWEMRLAKGEETLLNNTINGYGGMPPLGSCMDCDAEDFMALIRFMAKGS